ncbi:hypothetical protein NM688_g1590 [Phlebia brevispora]|uniref:Uncharacterized protein n=1 Tax=Phlebia brevispora TaxID=194682 RepID=A0ACC1TB98_9APHY|nr:hypothetical protein NM688_g1590 [Phlebia brevispora]
MTFAISKDTYLPPNAEQRDIATLATIDLQGLVTRDPAEITKLLDACVTHGFFYLNLQTSDAGRQILEAEQNAYRFMEEYFSRPLETKMKDDRGHPTHGFKPIGKYTGVTDNSRDCYETLKVARAEILAKAPQLSPSIKENSALFDTFISLSHFITQTLLSSLSDALRLTGSSRLEEFHRDGELTNTTLVLLHYPKHEDDTNIGHNKHTDIGSITLLFAEQWGLQVFTPEEKRWAWVQPRPHGHATINVGDSLRFLSGKTLYSCLHRVIPVDGKSQKEDRYSIAYFLRPENNAIYEDADGQKVTAGKWHDDKYVMFGEPHKKQEESKVLTGGMEQILV